MAQEEFYLPGNLQGIAESPVFTSEDHDSNVSVVHESDRCVAAWIEFIEEKDGASITRKFPILPTPRNGPSSVSQLPAKVKYKIVACVGNRGFFRGRIYT